VGAAYGSSQFTPSGFDLWANLPAGYYQVTIYARSTVTATWSQAQSVYLTVNSAPAAAVDSPTENQSVGQPFTLTGWAVDSSSPSGNGVPFLHIYAYPQNGAPAIWIGAPNTRPNRSDIAAWLQDVRFAASAWDQTVTGLPAGTYMFVIYPYSSVTGFVSPLVRWVTVQ
jgi:hypothetical protein